VSYNSFAAWYVGQKVRCVNGSFPLCVWEYCDAVPVAGNIYTIRRVYRSPNHTSGNLCISFYLEEIVNPAIGKTCETGFCYARFRPLEEAETTRAHEVAEVTASGTLQ
jgi:hypothetical protein